MAYRKHWLGNRHIATKYKSSTHLDLYPTSYIYENCFHLNHLAPWGIIPLEKLVAVHLVHEFSHFMELQGSYHVHNRLLWPPALS